MAYSPRSKVTCSKFPSAHSSSEKTSQHRHLLEAIQLKMVELQNGLMAYEHDVEAREQEWYTITIGTAVKKIIIIKSAKRSRGFGVRDVCSRDNAMEKKAYLRIVYLHIDYVMR
ncbi:hypothetical protein EVAR_101438_1 [Eumeta japonica]|uniref:Uncharacterized protein n=1 Tax=Eumeta variegata TaxID=151549 RepID=A0A4C1TU28_EUMVA|nr:hypothetical protein EVAR_101438_1 [Eumeta japonica]